MKRTILIPTDFSAPSLDVVEHVIANAGENPVDIVLTHCMFLPATEDIEMRFFSKKELIHSLRGPEFKKAYRTMRLRYPNANVVVKTDLFTGWSQRAFDNYLEGNRIDEAVIPKTYKPALNLKTSFDPIPFIRKSRLKITEVEV